MLQNIWTALEEEEIQIFGITPAFCSKTSEVTPEMGQYEAAYLPNCC